MNFQAKFQLQIIKMEDSKTMKIRLKCAMRNMLALDVIILNQELTT